MVKSVDEKNPTPDPAMAMIFFFIVTSVYCVISIFLNSSQQRLVIKVCYVLLIIVGQFFINLNLTESMCGIRQWKSTLFTTIVPWLIIFIVLHLFLVIFPGWLVPFSNTFGYLVAKLMGLPDLMKEMLAPPVGEDKEISNALESIRVDNSLFINELYTEDDKFVMDGDGKFTLDADGKKIKSRPNFDKTWDRLVNTKIIDPAKQKDYPDFKDRLYAFVQMKFSVAEYVWNLLTGFFVTSVTYNYIINTGCSKSAKEMEERYNTYQAEASKDKKKKEEEEKNKPNYVQT